MSIRVAIVEDDERLRAELGRLIESAADMSLVSAYASAEAALEGLAHAAPDVVLMDVNLGGMNGIECTRRLTAAAHSFQIVMLTSYESNESVFDALSAGAMGYVLKRAPGLQILEAVREVHGGGSPMSAAIARKVVQFFGKRRVEPAPAQAAAPASSEIGSLTEREHAVLTALAQGLQYKEIADSLDISINTVRQYVKRLYEKLHVHTRLEAVRKLGSL